jgi:hypothetical protein
MIIPPCARERRERCEGGGVSARCRDKPFARFAGEGGAKRRMRACAAIHSEFIWLNNEHPLDLALEYKRKRLLPYRRPGALWSQAKASRASARTNEPSACLKCA